MPSYRSSSQEVESSITEKKNKKTCNLVCLPFITFESVDSNVSSLKLRIKISLNLKLSESFSGFKFCDENSYQNYHMANEATLNSTT